MEKQELKQIGEYIKERYTKCNLDYKTFNNDLVDEKLSYEDNLKIIEDKLPKTKEQQEAEEVIRIRQEQEKEFIRIKETATDDILEKHFEVIKELTKAMILAKRKKGCWFYGVGGSGKTENTRRALIELGLKEILVNSNEGDFKVICGVKSLLSFIKMLDEYSNKIIIIDDDSVTRNRDCANILKQALVGGYIQYESERTKINKMFEGKIIIISNDTIDNMDIDAVKSRCYTYNFILTWKQKIDCIYSFAKNDIKFETLTKKQKNEIVDYIKDITNEATESLTLRTFEDGCELYLSHPTKWKSLLIKLLYPKPEYYLLIQSYQDNKIPDYVNLCIQTGLSKTRLYEIAKQLKLTENGRNQHK